MDRVDRAQRRFPPLGVPIAVIYKFFDDQGNYLAATITYYAFIAIFPLLLLGTSALDLVLQGNSDLEQQVLDSALAQFPIIGTSARRTRWPERLDDRGGSRLAAAVYGALGLGRRSRTRPTSPGRCRATAPQPGPAAAQEPAPADPGRAGGARDHDSVHPRQPYRGARREHRSYQWPILVGTVIVNTLVFTLFFRVAAARRHSFRSAIAGAFAVAVMWLGLQYAGTWFVQRVLDSTSEMNQTFGLVLGLIGIIFIAAVMGVLGMEVKVVLERRLWPRALLALFKDDVDLTDADRKAYSSYAWRSGTRPTSGSS